MNVIRVAVLSLVAAAFGLSSAPAYADGGPSTTTTGVEIPGETIGGVGNGPCVKTAGDQVTLSPSVSVTFGSGSGFYLSCPQ
jgi:hypothetical protein